MDSDEAKGRNIQIWSFSGDGGFEAGCRGRLGGLPYGGGRAGDTFLLEKTGFSLSTEMLSGLEPIWSLKYLSFLWTICMAQQNLVELVVVFWCQTAYKCTNRCLGPVWRTEAPWWWRVELNPCSHRPWWWWEENWLKQLKNIVLKVKPKSLSTLSLLLYKQGARIFWSEKGEERREYLFVTVYVFIEWSSGSRWGHQFSDVLNERQLNVY